MRQGLRHVPYRNRVKGTVQGDVNELFKEVYKLKCRRKQGSYRLRVKTSRNRFTWDKFTFRKYIGRNWFTSRGVNA